MPLDKPFAARFETTCSECGKPIHRGQYIAWSRREGKKSYHLNCDAPDSMPTIQSELQALKSAVAALPAEISDPDTKRYLESVTIDTLPEASEDAITEDAKPDELIEDASTLQTPAPTDSTLMSLLATSLMPYIDGKLSQKLDKPEIERIVNAAIKKHVAPAPRTINVNVTRPDDSKITIENAHAIFPKLLYLISKRHPVLLYDAPDGGPGSGKTTAAMQAIKAIGASRHGYISLNPQTPNSSLQGFIDASGVFRSTVFHDCYANGGVFIFDEIDHSGGMVLTTLNAAIENGSAAFPSGMVTKHPDFILIATANTPGYGANHLHPERRPIDGATRDRFTYLPVSYDRDMERSIALSINPNSERWVTWIQVVRDYCTKNKVKCMVTPRASYRGADYLRDGVLSASEIADAVVFRGIDPSVRSQILKEVGAPLA